MPAHPESIVWGARVRTLDPALPFCSAVAIQDGTIVATGDDDSIRAMRGPGTTLIDGTTVRIPYRGWFLPDGTNMENHGATPDVLVTQTPEDESRDYDAQLKAAVDDLMKRVR